MSSFTAMLIKVSKASCWGKNAPVLVVYTKKFVFHSQHNPIKISGWWVESSRNQDVFHLVAFLALAMVNNGLAMVQGGQGMGRGRETPSFSLHRARSETLLMLTFH